MFLAGVGIRTHSELDQLRRHPNGGPSDVSSPMNRRDPGLLDSFLALA